MGLKRYQEMPSGKRQRTGRSETPDGEVSTLPEIPFQLATAVTRPPREEGWVYEIKLDGYRIMARVEDGKATIITRGGKDWTHRFGRIAETLPDVVPDRSVIDGEVVVLDRQGRSNFSTLAEVLGEGDDREILFFAFDAPFLDGEDLRELPLLERKERLAAALKHTRDPVRYLDHVVGQGEAFLRTSCEVGLEGSIGKQADRPYFSGRSDDWRKLKCEQREEFVVVGWTDPRGSRSGFGALLLATRRKTRGDLVYVGKMGTGFDEAALNALKSGLDALARETPALAERPPRAETGKAHWIEPSLVAEVVFTGWTAGGRIRHGVFKGLREDKAALEVVMEGAEGQKGAIVVEGVAVSNAGRVIDALSGLTKGDLATWYAEAAERLLEGLGGRPMSVVRCPAGTGKVCFFQKHAGEGFPAEIHAVRVEEEKGPADYISVDDVSGLVSLVQMGVIELHPWGARGDDVDRPDRIIFDLDPDPTLPWRTVVEAALQVRTKLGLLGLDSFVRTTGGKGLHVVAPIRRTLDWDVVKPFTKAVAEALVREDPNRYTAALAKAKRQGKIFVDYLRNGKGATAVASWSVRARPGAAVAMPIQWEELLTVQGGDAFGIAEARKRLQEPDPWVDYWTLQQEIRQEALEEVKK